MSDNRRVVVTGYGGLCCLGIGIDEIWRRLIAGECGIGRITQFDASACKTQIAGEIPGFDPTVYVSEKESRHLDRFIQLAIAAAEEALGQAGLLGCRERGDVDCRRIGSVVSSGIGGLHEIYEQTLVLHERGFNRVSPFFVPKMISDMASGHLSIRHGLKGPNFGVVSACATGCHSIGEAFHVIRRDDADVMLAGGTEAAVQELCIAGFNALKALSTRNDEPQRASRPFDLNRDGFVPAEGAGVLVLEELEHARRRGANILCEVIGYGATGDGFHITSPSPDGEGDAEAFAIAMRHAGVRPDEVDYGTTPSTRPSPAAARSARPPTGAPSAAPRAPSGTRSARRARWSPSSASAPSRRGSSPPPSTTRRPTPTATSTSRPTRPGRATSASPPTTTSASADTTASSSSGDSRAERTIGISLQSDLCRLPLRLRNGAGGCPDSRRLRFGGAACRSASGVSGWSFRAIRHQAVGRRVENL